MLLVCSRKTIWVIHFINFQSCKTYPASIVGNQAKQVSQNKFPHIREQLPRVRVCPAIHKPRQYSRESSEYPGHPKPRPRAGVAHDALQKVRHMLHVCLDRQMIAHGPQLLGDLASQSFPVNCLNTTLQLTLEEGRKE